MNTAAAERIINVYVRDRLYMVNLDTETVKAHVFRASSVSWHLVRTTSREIETSALLRASDAWHRKETIAPQTGVPQASRDLFAA